METLDLIDEWLKLTNERELFSSDEIRDFLLDLRLSFVPELATPQLVTT